VLRRGTCVGRRTKYSIFQSGDTLGFFNKGSVANDSNES
jgi:hypothetical protein